MKKIQLLILLFCLSMGFQALAQDADATDCTFLKQSKLKYIGHTDPDAYIHIQDTVQTEYMANGNYIKSKLEWLNDCEYVATLNEIKMQKFPFELGEQMRVRVDSISEGLLHCSILIRGKIINGKYEVME